jgi:hypothetical protein
VPLTSGAEGLELVRILEAANQSLKHNGAAVEFEGKSSLSSNGGNGNNHPFRPANRIPAEALSR